MIDKTAKVWLGGRKGVTAPIHLSQYDTGWRFLFSVYDGDAVYNGTDSTTVYMEGKKADGTVFAVPGTFSDGVAVVECAASITAAVGVIDCELRINEDGETVGTANFDMLVEAAPLRGYVASGDDFSAMQQVLDGSEAAAADALSAKNAAATSAAAAALSAATAQVQAGMAYQIAATAAAMTDHTIGYVYVGNETGYVYGGWYYWDGTAWTLGGQATDSTLSVSGAPADAKVTGDEIRDLKSALKDITGNSEITGWISNKFIDTSGDTVDITDLRFSSSFSCVVVDCQADDVFTISGHGGSSARMWCIIDSEGNVLINAPINATLSQEVITAPTNADKLILNDDSGSLSYYGDLLVVKVASNKTDIDTNKSAIEVISENYNLINIENATVNDLTLVNNADGSITLNGAPLLQTRFDAGVLKAGTYVYKKTVISGSAPTNAVRYQDGSSTTLWAENAEQTFTQDTAIIYACNDGTFSNYKVKLEIINVNDPITGKDMVSRNKITDLESKIANNADAISALQEYALPNNLLAKYNVFTCVDKTKVEINAQSNLLVYGDSITYGAGGTSWVTYLHNIIGCATVNKAVTGALYGESVRTSDKWISTQIANTTDEQFSAATLVILAAGTNDAGYETTDTELKTKVQSAISSIRAKNATVPILFITPIKRGTATASDIVAKLPYFSGIIENVALNNDCSVICGLDFPIPSFSEGVIDAFTDDHIHPDNTGELVFAKSVINAVL